MPDLTIFYIWKEVRIRSTCLIISYCITWSCCYIFSEELLFLLAKPFLPIFLHSFISTQLTESLNTYITSSFILSTFFCMPLFFYQVWCFFIPSCYISQRIRYLNFGLMSLISLICFLLLSFCFVLPTIWLFLYKCADTSTSLFVIQLQPKIYDFIMLTLRFLLVSSIGSQIPVILLWLIESNYISIENSIKQRKYFLFFCLLLSALITPPDLWCQLFTSSLIFLVIEITFVYAFIRKQYRGQGLSLDRAQ